MNFQYTFQKVVDLKTNEKTQAEWLLSNAIGNLQAEEQSLHQFIMNQNQMMQTLQSAIESKAPAAEIQEIQRYIDYLEQCIAKKRRDVDRAQINVQKKQAYLTTKVLDEKVWLKSREKAKEKFQHEMLLREQNELDELAAVRFAIKAR
ncbi:flagellar export protein FliJ [Paenibacillus sediminis]|uniref:Flagellar FliJ protein n=1 Tax=Paenibacillus sediminis TaxID=664909 RepID=A0ABS4H1L9_9BACL|nr:flagellar export protein FliJ [Paenibacillus sediminis]MBP1936424.1 flagellar FliJ protein [Paenibacillus sediminis]